MSSSDLVLVTGASGFLAMHVIDKFIKEGFRVRGTLRDLNETAKVESVRSLAPEDKLEIVQADLLDDVAKWKEVMKGVTIVIHVASPFPVTQPDDENVLIKPAVNGTLSVLNAAFDEKVKRVVVTSSTAAVVGGHDHDRLLTEQDWLILEKSNAYFKSKYLAEKAAWDFVENKKKANEKCFDLVVINPGFLMGPRLSVASAPLVTSEKIFTQLLNHKVEKVPNAWYLPCDVRDAALAHYIGAFSDAAVGHRHMICTINERIPLQLMALLLKSEFESKGYKIPEIDLDEAVAQRPSIIKLDLSRMKNVLGIDKATPVRKSAIDMANRLIELGLIEKP